MLSHDGSLAVFDAGLTCRLAPEIAQPFGYLLQALCTGNTDRVVDKLCFFSQNIDESKVDMESFRSDMHKLMLDYVDQKSMNSPDGRPINMGVMVGAMLQCMQKHKLQLRGDVALTIMTMAISESLIRQLDPDFDLVRSTVSIPAFSTSVFVSPKKILIFGLSVGPGQISEILHSRCNTFSSRLVLGFRCPTLFVSAAGSLSRLTCTASRGRRRGRPSTTASPRVRITRRRHSGR